MKYKHFKQALLFKVDSNIKVQSNHKVQISKFKVKVNG